jgi:hypothetical protein
VDLSKFKTSDWLKIGGAIGILIFGFLNWVTVSYSDDFFGSGYSYPAAKAFDFFWTGTLPWVLVIAVGVVTVLRSAGVIKGGSFPWPLVMLILSGLSALLLVLRLVINPIDGKSLAEEMGIEFGRGIGLYLSTLAGLASAAGSVMGFTESGGNLNDLKDVNKLKNSFGQGGGSMPPPPPP